MEVHSSKRFWIRICSNLLFGLLEIEIIAIQTSKLLRIFIFSERVVYNKYLSQTIIYLIIKLHFFILCFVMREVTWGKFGSRIKPME